MTIEEMLKAPRSQVLAYIESLSPIQRLIIIRDLYYMLNLELDDIRLMLNSEAQLEGNAVVDKIRLDSSSSKK